MKQTKIRGLHLSISVIKENKRKTVCNGKHKNIARKDL